MRLSYEIPVKSERNYRAVGLSTEENKRFWLVEDRFNQIYHHFLLFTIFIYCLAYNAPLFFGRYHVDLATYILVQTIHVVHTR